MLFYWPHAQGTFSMHLQKHYFLLCYSLVRTFIMFISVTHCPAFIDIHHHLQATQSPLPYMEIRLSPHNCLLLRWCLHKFVVRAFHFQSHILNIIFSSWSYVQSPHTQIFFTGVVMVLPLNCSLPPEWWDTTVYSLPRGPSFSSWTFDCSKGRCQPSGEGTYIPYHTVLCYPGNNILCTTFVVFMWHCSGVL